MPTILENATLTEDEVIHSVCRWRRPEYEIVGTCTPKEQGDDIVARKLSDGSVLYVEAKGSTSSRENSGRYGKPFTPQQTLVHLGNALRKIAEVLSREADNPKARFAIALAYTHDSDRGVEKIKPALTLWHVGLMWVHQDGSIDVDLAWG